MPTALTRRLTLVMGVRGLQNIRNRFGGLQASLSRLRNTVLLVSFAFTSLAAVLGVQAFVESAKRFDSLQRGMLSVTGSAIGAAREIERLQEVAKLPGLGFEEAIQGSINLQAAGISADQSRKLLLGFGNALATVGKGKHDLAGVILALTQTASSGRLLGQELRQLQQRVPQIRALLVDAFGTADTEELAKRGISARQFFQEIGGALLQLPRMTSGVQNAFENFQDALFRIRVFVGQRLLPPIVRALEQLDKSLSQNADSIEKFANFLGNVTVAVINFTKATASWIAANKELVIQITAIVAGLTALGIAIAIITSPLFLLGAALIASVVAWNNWKADISKIVNEAWMAIRDFVNRAIQAFVNQLRITRIIFTGIKDIILAIFSSEPGSIGKAASDVFKQIKETTKQTMQEDFVSSFEIGFGKAVTATDSFIETMKQKFAELTRSAPSIDFLRDEMRTPKAVKPRGPLGTTSMEDRAKNVAKSLADMTPRHLQSFNDSLREMLNSFDTLAEKIQFVGMLVGDELGTAFKAVFQGGLGGANAFYNTLEAQSKAFFKGETTRLVDFGELGRQVWAGIATAVLDSLAKQLKGKATDWGLEGAALVARGIATANPAMVAGGAKLLGVAALAGAGAAIISGLSGATGEKAQESLARSTGQLPPLTPEEEAAGVRRTTGSTIRTGTFSSQGNGTFNINPIVNFYTSDGGIVAIDSGGLEEAGEVLGDQVSRIIEEGFRNGRF